MQLAEYIYAQIASGALEREAGLAYLRDVVPEDIAIVGMSCEYTGAPDLFAFEEMLRAGRNGFKPFPENRRDYFPKDHRYLVDATRMYGRDADELFEEMCTQLGSYLEDVDQFDNDFFDIPEDEATYIDPMHRLVLKHLHLALEHSGATRAQVQGSRAAIYMGKDRSIAGSYASEIEQDNALINPGTWEGILASRLNYLYDLSGGSLVVDTACSSSLVAAHIAKKMLRDGEIDMAMVGGIALGLAPRQGEVFGDYASVETTRDHLKVFDAASSGTIFGEGVGVVVLRRLSDAIERGDHVYAVLRATGINSDGRSNGLTAPNPRAQSRLIAETYTAASISPSTIDYVDAHGTGTKLGDPIEIRGLADAFRDGGVDTFGTCALSSLKENIGHTVGAAGVGGMIKMALALDSQSIFPSSGFTVPNDFIKFVDTPFYVPDGLARWERGDHPRRGAISSFGFSGTNGHVVLEEASPADVPPAPERPLPFLVSAPSDDQLLRVLDSFLEHAELVARRTPADVALTLLEKRTRYNARVGFVATTMDEFLARIADARDAVAGQSAAEIAFASASASLGSALGTTPSEAGRMIAKQYAAAPDTFSLDDRVRLTVHGEGEFLADFDHGSARACGLPGHQFATKRLWATVKTYDVYSESRQAEEQQAGGSIRTVGEPVEGVLLSRRVVTTPDTDVYEVDLDPARWFLHDHRIAGESTLSGTAYAQLAADIARLHFGAPAYELRRMMFKALIQVPGARTVLVQVVRRSIGELAVEVFAPEAPGEPLVPHASFLLRRPETVTGAEPVAPSVFDGVERMELRDEADGQAFGFSGRWDVGLNPMRFVSPSPTEHLLRLDLAPAHQGDVDDFDVSPSILDLLAGAISWERSAAVSRQFLPLSYGRLVFTGERLTPTSYSRTRLLYHPETDPSVASADIWVFNDSGELVVHIERYSMRVFVPQSEALTYHEVVLHPTTVDGSTGTPPSTLLVGDAQSTALVAQGWSGDVSVATPAELTGWTGQKYGLVVHVVPEPVADPASASAAVDSFVEFATGISRVAESDARVVVLARRGLAVETGDPVEPLDYAALSTARVVGMENPRLRVVAVSDASLSLAAAWRVASDDRMTGRKVLIHGDAAWTEALVPLHRALPARRGLDHRGLVLVTGGFGGIGVEYLALLWSEFQCDVVVLGRRSLDDLEASDSGDDRARAERVRALVGDGLQLQFRRCDVGDPAAVADTLASIRADGRPVAGVVHLAGAPDQGMLFRKSTSDVHRVVDSKALGALALLEGLDRDSLQFFVVSSSMTTITGAPGQFAYTFANAFLEGLAHAHTIVSATRWPGWSETGMAVAFGVADVGAEFLLDPLSTAAARGYVRQSITREYVDLVAGQLTPAAPRFLESYVDLPSGAPSSGPTAEVDLEAAVTLAADPSAAPEGLVVREFADLVVTGVDRELDDLEKFVAVLFASVLSTDRIDASASFTDLGGDSLMAFSIFTPLTEQLDVDLEVADIFIYSSVLELSEHVRSVQRA
jgi:3-oxoacyl-(acyl-carrier-protein) synthase/acyl carrier protein/NADP-dependent 3-hydroxy acid dehydrogenase YdfG